MLDVDSTQKQKKENLGNNKKVVSPFGDWGIIQGPWMFPNYHEPNVTEFQPMQNSNLHWNQVQTLSMLCSQT